MPLSVLREACYLCMALVLFAGCGGSKDRPLQADVSELQAFEAQQKLDREADLEAMKAGGQNAAP